MAIIGYGAAAGHAHAVFGIEGHVDPFLEGRAQSCSYRQSRVVFVINAVHYVTVLN